MNAFFNQETYKEESQCSQLNELSICEISANNSDIEIKIENGGSRISTYSMAGFEVNKINKNNFYSGYSVVLKLIMVLIVENLSMK